MKKKTSLQEIFLRLLYGNPVGRLLLKVLLISPQFSELCGKFMDSPLSKGLIPLAINRCNIDLTSCVKQTVEEYTSMNDFFTRQLKVGSRPIDYEATHFISPCDSNLIPYCITPDLKVPIKGRKYTVDKLLRDSKLAQRYQGGYMLVFRLSVENYHHYCYVDDGQKTGNRRIAGVLHTVHPIAQEQYPVYWENTREYSILHSENFGHILMMEVGALLVGRIVNHHQKLRVQRGQEKGMFEFGGSTVILLVEKDRLRLRQDIIQRAAQDLETAVRLGECIGEVREEKNYV